MLRTEKDQFQQTIELRFNQGERKVCGFLTNFKTRTYIDTDQAQQRMALLCYFQDQFGQVFKCYYPHNPYFYVGFQQKAETQVRLYIESKVPKILHMQTVEKIDLEEINHLSGRMKKYLKLSFRTIGDLTNARKFLDVKKKKNTNQAQYYLNPKKNFYENPKDYITDIRQFDVPYHCRVCIDTGIRAGKWFQIELKDKFIVGLSDSSRKSIPDMKILAYDIETSKDPFKFPEKQKDVIIMISIMFEGEGVLIINGGFCNQKVQQFDYHPEQKAEFSCHVQVYNMSSEKQTLQMFCDIIRNYKPTVITSFNGDRFDYPFIEARCAHNYVDFYKSMGVNNKSGQYFGAYISHLDCYYWVDRDAYLPQGSRGLKAVTRAKLKYEPIEVDPEKMVEMGKYRTRQLAEYAISDAVATFYLYMKHIHGFIYALATIIPMMPDEVLRKGSGTLCENLLMAEAYSRNIIFPNKQIENFEKFYKGHLLESQTYTGGKVQCLRSGIYRSDFPTDFTLSPKAFQSLIDSLDEIIQFTIRHETSESMSNIENLEQVKKTIVGSLQKLKEVPNPSRYETFPLIYHIDVAAMYPNIIITNRLQPVAVVNDQICSGCLFNSPQYNCKRSLQWEWRGEYFPLNEGQFSLIKQKQALKLDPNNYNSKLEQQKNIKSQVKKYCQKIYSKSHISVSEVRRDTVCMRENSFYVDTVRAFRDRRYQYKKLTKVHKTFATQRAKEGKFEQQKEQIKLMELYQSMQLAHKIILNSFYGYVMRKGSRWYSMQTAAMVTYIGSNIINDSKNFIEARLGKPLQLDTDGIWMLLPQGFPEDVKIKFKNGKSFSMSYPCQILNHLIYEKYANPQYQELQNQQNFEYETRKQMTIAFEIDGPYKAMFIPGGKDKKKTNQLDIQQHSTQMLKKRYVVFNHKNQVSQYKGLEMKRRGQLNIIKMFQKQIFGEYVKGKTLKQCYQFCGRVAMKYFKFILDKGKNMDLEGVLERLQQSKNLSKDVNQYGQSKGVAISAARRLADYLGPQVAKGKNLCLYYIISAYPPKRPVTERAIPTQIFFADADTQRKFLFKWTKSEDVYKNIEIQHILDWDYYKERLATQIQKMVCIPAVMQNLPNPIAQIDLPDWLQKKTFDMRYHRQEKIQSYGFVKLTQKNNIYETEKKHHSSHKKMIDNKNQPQLQSKILFQQAKKTFLRKSQKNPYSLNSNFKEWFNIQKKIWKDHKRQVNINQSLKFQQLKSVLQITPIQSSPGLFTVWYYSGNRIQNLLLNFRRRYYAKDSKKGTKKAPREQGLAIQLVLEEPQFENTPHLLDNPLEQVFYETKLPLLTGLILKKGNLWKISKHLSLYKDQDIQEAFGSDYLPRIQEQFMPVVYFTKLTVLENKHMFAIFSPKTLQYTIIYLDNSIGKANEQLLRLARKTIKKDDAKITIKTKHTERQVGKQLQEFLLALQKSFKQKFLVILQSQSSVQYLKSIGIESLQQDMPILKLPGYNLEKVTSLDWKQKALIKVIEQSVAVDSKIVNLLEWSRYTHIPICNLSQNQNNLLDYITNITYGRLLHSGDNITWWNQYNSEIVQTYQCKTQTGRIVNPGVYTSYCIEINMDNLAINTIANSDELVFEDRDTAMMIQKNTNKKQQQSNKIQYLDEMTQAKRAFEYLKKMIKGWIQDLKINLDKSNDLLRNFHKWITTHSNALYDPLLSKFVNELMKKMFSILIKKLSNLGLHIIYASFSKIIVSTDKHTYKQAENMITYALQKCATENQKLFGYLSLEPLVNYYQVLLYKDPYNFVGIFVNGEQNRNSGDEPKMEIENDEEETMDRNLEYSVQMSRIFNPIVRLYFKRLILQFSKALCLIKRQLIKQYSNNKMKLMLNYDSLIAQRTISYIENNFTEEVLGSIQSANEDWQQCKQNQKKQTGTRVEEEVQKISEDQDQNEEDDSFIDDDEDLFSQDKNSSHQKKQKKKKKKKGVDEEEQNKIQIDFQKWGSDKQLDMLIETLFNLLNHDEVYSEAFDNLRRKCFQLIHQESSFTHRYIKPQYPHFQLPCKNCYLVNQKPGKCEHCHQQLDAKIEVENTIWKMMQEQGRDLYCNRCKMIMQGFLKKCQCGGQWEFGQQPLQWLPYMPREDPSWEYCNRVFQFMGIK